MKKVLKHKKILIIGSVVLIIFGLLFTLYETIYLDHVSSLNINLNGESEITLELDQEYTEKGAKATFREKDLSKKIEIKNNINNKKIGIYEVEYKINYKNKTSKIVRKIKVVDKIKPVITLKENEVTIYIDESYTEPGYSATDNYDGDITDKVVVEDNIDNKTEGEYEVKYTVEDSSGNKEIITRKVKVEKKPTIHRPGVAVLNYHFFYGDGESCGAGICLHTSKFEEHLKYLTDNGYKTLTMEEFRAWIYGEIEIPEKSVLITIDDGAMGTGTHNGNKLIPLLEKYHVHATLFLITGWWSINNYQSAYLDIESHTNDMHTESYCSGVTRGAKMLCLSHDEVINDLKTSISITGSTKAFCYPFYAYNEAAIQEVKEAGFKLAFAGGNYKATRSSNKYAIPRFAVQSNITLDKFISYIS